VKSSLLPDVKIESELCEELLRKDGVEMVVGPTSAADKLI